MAKFRLVRRKKRTRTGLTAALAGFAILCGVVLLLGGTGTELSCDGSESAEQRLTRQVLSAFRATQRAHRALESGNYGMVKRHVRRAQDSLTNALGELNASPGAAERGE